MELESKIRKVLLKLGILPDKKAFDYITYILLIYENSNIRDNLTSIIYRDVAKKFNSTYSNVERAIRYAVVRNCKVIDRLNKILELEDEYKIEKITNAEFLCLLKLLVEE